MDLSRTNWVDKLATRVVRIGGLLAVSEVADVYRLSSQLKQTLLDLSRLIMDLYGSQLNEPKGAWGPARARVPQGRLPEAKTPWKAGVLPSKPSPLPRY